MEGLEREIQCLRFGRNKKVGPRSRTKTRPGGGKRPLLGELKKKKRRARPLREFLSCFPLLFPQLVVRFWLSFVLRFCLR